jgi:hypothetical protein
MSDSEPTLLRVPRRARRSSGDPAAPGPEPVPLWVWVLLGSGVLAVLLLICGAGAMYVYGSRPAVATPGELPTISLVTIPAPTATMTVPAPTAAAAATLTAVPTPTPTLPPAPPGSLAIGSKVQVVNTGGVGLSLRSEPGTDAPRVAIALDGELLAVTDGPRVISSYTWWKLKRTDGVEGWGVQNFLQLIP